MSDWTDGLKKSVRKEVCNPREKVWGVAAGLCVYLVNGPAIRKDIDIDFTEGGHNCRYGYIPRNEVWIENEESEEERRFLLLHELFEHRLMDFEGLDYEAAHAQASSIEKDCRSNPNKLDAALASEGWKNAKDHGDERSGDEHERRTATATS